MRIFWLVAHGLLAVTAFESYEKHIRIKYIGSLFNAETEELYPDKNNLVTLLLYTNAGTNDGEEIRANAESIKKSSFNPNNLIVFCIHGWKQSRNVFFNSDMRNAFFSVGNYNFIFVEWQRALYKDYLSSVWAVSGVGKQVANFIDFLVREQGILRHNIMVVGHSLGAHIAGFCGKYVKSGPLVKIVGLDPAGPLFNFRGPSYRLDSTDALYVVCIYTNIGMLGLREPVGHANFYPNGGKTQPGCVLDYFGICSHKRSVDIYVDSIRSNGSCAIKCNSYEDALARNCDDNMSDMRMGANINGPRTNGIFYIPVTENRPYINPC